MPLGTDTAGVKVRKQGQMAVTVSVRLEILAESGLKRKRTENVCSRGNVFFTLISLLICLLFVH